MDKLKCRMCKQELSTDKFKQKENKKTKEITFLKGCIVCNDKNKAKNDSKRCEHKRLKNTCKECGDPIEISIKTILSGSKFNDIRQKRYDEKNFIDKKFVRGLLEETDFCPFPNCGVMLQHVTYRDDLASIKRKDAKFGHTKENCIICCRLCNTWETYDPEMEKEIEPYDF
jgi:hypothetical protein